MDFTPNTDNENPQDVPYYEDVTTAGGGWRGQTTGKRIDTLKSEITQHFNKLGATVLSFQEGVFGKGGRKERHGYRIRCQYEIGGQPLMAEIIIASLPVKPLKLHPTKTQERAHENKIKKSLKMALFMYREHVEGMWFMQMLSPGYMPLTPNTIDPGTGKTFQELFIDQYPALPAPKEDGDSEDVIDIQFEEN